MELFLQDVRQGIRSLAKSKLYSVTAIFCLTLSIGAVGAIFSMLNAVVLNAYPFVEPDKLVDIQLVNRTEFDLEDNSDPTFTMPQRALDPFMALEHKQPFGWKADRGFAITEVETAFSLSGSVVSGNYFSLVQPEVFMGRLLTEEDVNQSLAVLSFREWQSTFGADPNIIGSSLTIDGTRHSVVGVLARDHRYPNYADLWVPEKDMVATGSIYDSGNSYNLITRLLPGQSVEQLNEQLVAVSDQFISIDPGMFNLYTFYGITVTTLLARGGQVGDILQLLMYAVFALLLIASANVANLMLSRMHQQEQELSLRAALGARGGRLARRLTVESGILALLSSVLGIGLAYLMLPLIVEQSQGLINNPERVRIDGYVLAFSVAVALITTLLVSIAPLFRVLTSDLAGTLRAGGNKGMMGGSQTLRKGLVTAEAALTFVLLVGAGLMMKSYQQIQSIDMGFSPDKLQTIVVHAPPSRAGSHKAAMQFYAEMITALKTIPGVIDAAVTHALPVNDRSSSFSMTLEDFPPIEPGDLLEPAPVGEFASRQYLEVLDVALLEGRYFDSTDVEDGLQTVIISKNMADFYWPNESALGKRLKRGTYADSTHVWWTVIGVVADVRSVPTAEPPHRFYRSVDQQDLARNFSDMRLSVRTTGEPGLVLNSIRNTIRNLSRDAVISNELTMVERIARVTRTQQMGMNIVMAFSAVGLILAIAGIFGVFSYNVQQRFREIGLRMVLGAKTQGIFILVLKSAVGLGSLGLGIGLVLTLSARDFLESYLFQVSGLDLTVYLSVTLILLAAIVVAACEPARRATRMDPIETLRHS